MAENTWSPEEFTINELHKKIEEEKTIEVPIYQRGTVWSQKQVDALMDTIKRGLPYGCILLYKKDDGHYMIIDGLQRITAIYKFVNEPGRFFNEDDIDQRIIREIASKFEFAEGRDETKKKLTNFLKKWVNEKKSMTDIANMQYVDFGVYLSSEYETLKGHEIEIGRIIEPMLANFRNLCQELLIKKVPAIVMKGTDKYLADVFDRINSKGTTLSKYNIYSAAWGVDKYKVDNQIPSEIIDANKERYEDMLYGDLVLADYNPVDFSKARELTMFELAFGFGKYISNKWPQLFGESLENTKIDSVGFNLINCCLCNPNSNLKNMHSIFKDRIGQAQACIFLEKIIECIEYIDKKIGSYNKFKGNSQKSTTPKPKHTEFQIISIIASVFINKYVHIEKEDDEITSISYDFSSENKEWSVHFKKQFEINVLKIYLMEILSGRWSGTGDKKMDMIIQDPLYYTRDIPEDEFRGVVSTWFARLNSERNELSKVSNPKEGELILLAALYISRFSAKMHLDDSTYDIEHLATKKLMKNRLDQYNGDLKLPISSFGNLCYLPSSVNRQKRDKTIYDDKAYISKCSNLDDLENKYTFTKKEDFDFLNNSLSRFEFKEAYFAFIQKRFNTMLNEIVKSLFK